MTSVEGTRRERERKRSCTHGRVPRASRAVHPNTVRGEGVRGEGEHVMQLHAFPVPRPSSRGSLVPSFS